MTDSNRCTLNEEKLDYIQTKFWKVNAIQLLKKHYPYFYFIVGIFYLYFSGTTYKYNDAANKEYDDIAPSTKFIVNHLCCCAIMTAGEQWLVIVTKRNPSLETSATSTIAIMTSFSPAWAWTPPWILCPETYGGTLLMRSQHWFGQWFGAASVNQRFYWTTVVHEAMITVVQHNQLNIIKHYQTYTEGNYHVCSLLGCTAPVKVGRYADTEGENIPGRSGRGEMHTVK